MTGALVPLVGLLWTLLLFALTVSVWALLIWRHKQQIAWLWTLLVVALTIIVRIVRM
jgi:hypothetical protein